jgi:hypothetical protein
MMAATAVMGDLSVPMAGTVLLLVKLMSSLLLTKSDYYSMPLTDVYHFLTLHS